MAGTNGRPYPHGLPHAAVTNTKINSPRPPSPTHPRLRAWTHSARPYPRTFAAPLNLVGYFLRMLRTSILRVFGPSQLLSQHGADDLLHSTRWEPVCRACERRCVRRRRMLLWGVARIIYSTGAASPTTTCAGRLGLRNRQSTEMNHTYFFPGAGRVLSTCCSAMCDQEKSR